ncbi:hypothetical protein Z043_120345 [Scleropages formosus]|uniref:Uncharacterized protein n=1 Tax=Scleropages formosus TaxID=113540 RepID=A0A0P7WK44_SCLFO|nr:hypothetical protein Z043_120345 [Scleropages formosus]
MRQGTPFQTMVMGDLAVLSLMGGIQALVNQLIALPPPCLMGPRQRASQSHYLESPCRKIHWTPRAMRMTMTMILTALAANLIIPKAK